METNHLNRRVTKGDIINRLIRQFGFESYLEYNKFDGASYYDEIICDQKEIAYLPEDSYLDAGNIQRLLGIASQVDFNTIMPLESLLASYEGRQFDIIFFDPVHVRPAVDDALRILPRLLKKGGVLVVHDCNPEHYALTTLRRRTGSWVGETFKAFALFRHFNRSQTLTISEDFGVGLIWNQDLQLDYPIDFDISYYDFTKDRCEYIGLIDYSTFLDRTTQSNLQELFQQSPQKQKICIKSHQFTHGGPDGQPLKRAICVNNFQHEAQLFWRCNNQEYTEPASRYQTWEADAGSQLLHFQLPDGQGEVTELRFDFSDTVCSVRLDCIRICDAQQKLVWEWENNLSDLKGARNLGFFLSDSNHTVIYLRANSDDPRFTLIPGGAEVAALIHGGYFEVGITPLPAILHKFLQSLGDSGSLNYLSLLNSQLIEEFLQMQRTKILADQRFLAIEKLCKKVEF